MRYLYLACVLTAACGFLRGDVTYTYQDGPILTDTVSVNGIGGGDAWLANQFYTQTGGEAISSITLAFGPNAASLPVSFLLYNDPDGDGQPNDLALLAQIDTTLGTFDPLPQQVDTYFTATFNTPVDVGSSFFVAVLFMNAPGTLDARADSTAPHGQSFFAGTNTGGTFSVTNPNGADQPPVTLKSLGADDDLEITANGVPGTQLVSMPEPSSIGLLAIGALAIISRRKLFRS